MKSLLTLAALLSASLVFISCGFKNPCCNEPCCPKLCSENKARCCCPQPHKWDDECCNPSNYDLH